MKRYFLLLLICLMAGCVVYDSGYAGQQRAAAGAEFPESLLEGSPSFNLAILLQGDLRGNFGPCG